MGRVEIGNAIIAGIAEGGGCLEQMSAIVERLTLAGFVIVPREPTAEMLSAAAPFPLHLVIERADVDYTNNMEAATVADRMAARSTYQIMIDAALSHPE